MKASLKSGHVYHRLYYHVIAHAKRKLPLLQGPARELIWNYATAKSDKYECAVLAMNGSASHLHFMLRAKPTFDLPRFVGELKGGSSFVINRDLGLDYAFSWQIGYAVFSISYGHVDKVKGYIVKQTRHHHCPIPLAGWYSADELSPWGRVDPVLLYDEAWVPDGV